MKKFGDVVVLMIGTEASNALVLASREIDNKEHLTLVSLHPSKDVGQFSSVQADAAIARNFDVEPWVEGAQKGWSPQIEEPAADEPEVPGEFVALADLENLSAKIVEHGNGDQFGIGEAVTSAAELIDRLANENAQTKSELGGWGAAALVEKYNELFAQHKAADEASTQAAATEITTEDAERLKQLSGSGGLAGATQGPELPEGETFKGTSVESEMKSDAPTTTTEG